MIFFEPSRRMRKTLHRKRKHWYVSQISVRRPEGAARRSFRPFFEIAEKLGVCFLAEKAGICFLAEKAGICFLAEKVCICCLGLAQGFSPAKDSANTRGFSPGPSSQVAIIIFPQTIPPPHYPHTLAPI
jgi:hypothetical protein